MARRRKRPAPRTTAEPVDPRGLGAMLERFLEHMQVKAYARATVENRRTYLGWFIAWCEERGISRPAEVTRPVLERYQRYLYHYRKKNGQPLSFRSQYSRLSPVRAFFKWLARENLILYNPASELELPRLRPRLPRHVLSPSEAERVLARADITDALGVRDRAILETLYSTGMRRSELIALELCDLDAERGTVLVRQGKGKKDRMIPIGQRALLWVDKYLGEVRPSLVLRVHDRTVFVSREGEPFTPDHLTRLVRDYVDAAELGKRGACHLFRHTMATCMLEGGADVRFIQQMLGHANLSTTQIYTQVSIRKLKQIHTATHPAAELRRHEPAREPTGEEDAEREALLSSLAAEAEEEDDGNRAP